MSTGAVIVLVIVVVLVLAAAAWFVAQQSRRRRLRERFGPEYDRRVEESGDRRVVERDLTEREKRHARYKLRPLSDVERARYAEQWTVLQEQFVDQPAESVAAAEQLVHMVMRERGYPAENVENVEGQAADLSVEHSHVVAGYRGARDIRMRHERAGVSTEELRQALTHLRAVFVSVAGLPEDRPATTITPTDATTPTATPSTPPSTPPTAPPGTATNAPTDNVRVHETRHTT
ncbi:MAG TPA: hypothetical protein VGP26_22565 [Actinophytocola sp.]|jgi:hypothetical protein|nr:hypothetical protein [Actinophytocola sp.]